jgi:hypothetical protein
VEIKRRHLNVAAVSAGRNQLAERSINRPAPWLTPLVARESDVLASIKRNQSPSQ